MLELEGFGFRVSVQDSGVEVRSYKGLRCLGFPWSRVWATVLAGFVYGHYTLAAKGFCKRKRARVLETPTACKRQTRLDHQRAEKAEKANKNRQSSSEHFYPKILKPEP